jgi:hypothetical protein
MAIPFVEPLLCVPGDRAGCCWNFALAFAPVAVYAGSMPNVPSRFDDEPAQMHDVLVMLSRRTLLPPLY